MSETLVTIFIIILLLQTALIGEDSYETEAENALNYRPVVIEKGEENLLSEAVMWVVNVAEDAPKYLQSIEKSVEDDNCEVENAQFLFSWYSQLLVWDGHAYSFYQEMCDLKRYPNDNRIDYHF